MTAQVPRFLSVGVLGFGVQLGVLLVLTRVGHWPYPLATLVAVEAAVLHNFVWHVHWTWQDRDVGHASVARQCLRFHMGTGLVSLIGNVIVTTVLVETLHIPTVVANIGAVCATSVANFAVADRWVFSPAVTVFSVLLVAPGADAAQLRPETIVEWERLVAARERQLPGEVPLRDGSPPTGRSVKVPGGIVHEWHGAVRIPNRRVETLVRALVTPGLPPPSPEVVGARVLAHCGDSLRVYMRVRRSALITMTYDMEHDVRFERQARGLATSRSASTMIREVDGDDHGFLWRLNSYWRYRQDGPDVVVDLVSLSLSRAIPAFLGPVASPIVDRIARESVESALTAVARLGRTLPPCTGSCAADEDASW